MLVTQDLGIGIVVEKAELLAPGHEHRELGREKEAHNGAKGLRPGRRLAQWRGRRVVRAHERAHLSAACQEGSVTQRNYSVRQERSFWRGPLTGDRVAAPLRT
jgi:hypothetical protein